MVIGDPVGHSLSPLMHNAGYEKAGIADEYVYIACHVLPERLSECVQGIRAMNVRGVSCTIPHKVSVMKYLDHIDTVAQKIGAVNTIVNDNGMLTGYNTDWLGVVVPLEKRISLKNKKVALLGAGGAARAIAYGVVQRGAELTIFNRAKDMADVLAAEFGGHAYSFDDLAMIRDVDVIINATPVGMRPLDTETPLPKESIDKHHIVFDIVYEPHETRLLREAREQGAEVIHGIEMLLHQGMAQFKLYTQHDAPEAVMREALMEQIKKKSV